MTPNDPDDDLARAHAVVDMLTSAGPWPGPWIKDGLCREYPGVSWFPSPRESAAEAVAICRRCTVQPECLAYALECGPSLHGVWGGSTRADRDQYRKNQRGAA